ncbi:MAG: hypothetical protein ACT4P7_20635 [Gemmatimonadaceae bacterium]
MRFTVLACACLAVACGPAEKTPAADSPAAAMAPAPLSLADVAGKWTYLARGETGDSVLVTAELNATADATGWTLTLPGRPVQTLEVRVDGDSIMTKSGTFESVLRKGVQVMTTSVLRLQDGKLVGTTVAHYTTTGADSVARLRVEATRVP